MSIQRRRRRAKSRTKNDSPILPPPQRLAYTRREVAALLGTSISTVVRLEQAGRLKAFSLSGRPGGRRYFRHADIVALLDGAK